MFFFANADLHRKTMLNYSTLHSIYGLSIVCIYSCGWIFTHFNKYHLYLRWKTWNIVCNEYCIVFYSWTNLEMKLKQLHMVQLFLPCGIANEFSNSSSKNTKGLGVLDWITHLNTSFYSRNLCRSSFQITWYSFWNQNIFKLWFSIKLFEVINY